MKPLMKWIEPANTPLPDSSVDAYDVMTAYSGNVVTDQRGYACIELPGFIQTMNLDFGYQLTVIGQFAQAIVLRKIHNNHFAIKSDRPAVEVSWQVTGIHREPLAETRTIESHSQGEEESTDDELSLLGQLRLNAHDGAHDC